MVKHRCLWACLALIGALACSLVFTRPAAVAVAGAGSPPAGWKAEVEADWLNQEVVRSIGHPALATQEDARGGCDGVKDGGYGFHTGLQADPWWQVDLGAVHPLSRVVVYNRNEASDRVAHLRLLVSEDGKAWREVYRHDGTVFYGARDGKPLQVPLSEVTARFVRVQVPGTSYLHLDEVEVYGAREPEKNLALGQEADQCSLSQWSTRKRRLGTEPSYPIEEVLSRGRALLQDVRKAKGEVGPHARALDQVAADLKALPRNAPSERRRALYLRARWAVRRLALANPLLDFDRLLFVKRAPGSFSHMSDQHYGWWSRPGGGVYVLEGLKSDNPRVRCLTASFPLGSFLGPDLSYDGKRVLFAYCRYYPNLSAAPDKVAKEKLPEDAFYHIYEMGVDGKGLRRLTRGRYDDFDPRYLPDGRIAFLSTRRGTTLQCAAPSATLSTAAALPDSYVRCGGDNWRPVSVYTLHVMDSKGGGIHAISPFENFEWTPSIAHDGRILYARWDYVDRDNMPYMSLWSTNPDGTQPQIVYGNFTRNPHCIFEARSIPGSRKILFTASAHHSITGGSVVLLDPALGTEGTEAITRLTPEVCFPETEGWPATYYANPWPLSEKHYLAAWSNQPLAIQGALNPTNAMGIYLCDAYGGLELLHRDPEISSMYPVPIKPRVRPPVRVHSVARAAKPDAKAPEGRILLMDVYEGLTGVKPGAVKQLRVVGVPAKTQPHMNNPVLGITGDDPGKFVIGTVPVEKDGSAYFRAPAGTPLFFQALDRDGAALQTMRSATYVQPGQTMTCIGCHEPRNLAPRNLRPAAASRPPSRLAPGPEGSWPLRFDRLVQPVLDRHCASCHSPSSPGGPAAKIDLSPAKAYESLIRYGKPSLHDHVWEAYRRGMSVVGQGAASTSPLLALLRAPQGHQGVRLSREDLDRLTTWMDTYAQRLGHYSPEQEELLRQLRAQCADLLETPGGPVRVSQSPPPRR